MARFKGIDIPSEKRVEIGLTYIFGIGRSLSNTILKDAGVDKDKKVKDLSADEEAKIREQLDKYLLVRIVKPNLENSLGCIPNAPIPNQLLLPFLILPIPGTKTSNNNMTHTIKI